MKKRYMVTGGRKDRYFRTEFFARAYYDGLGALVTKYLYIKERGRMVLLDHYFAPDIRPVWYR